jgi:hypothetical protein
VGAYARLNKFFYGISTEYIQYRGRVVKEGGLAPPPNKPEAPPPPPPRAKVVLKLVCNVNIVYGNLKSENSEDYAQKPERNCTFMNSASGLVFPS